MDKLRLISILSFTVFLYACQGGGEGKAESGTVVPINYSAKFIAQPKDTGSSISEATDILIKALAKSFNEHLYLPKNGLYLTKELCSIPNAYHIPAENKIVICDRLAADLLAFSNAYSSFFDLEATKLFSYIYYAVVSHELMHAYSYQAGWNWGINEERNADIYALIANTEYSDTEEEKIQSAIAFIALGYFVWYEYPNISPLFDLHDDGIDRAQYLICLAIGGVPKVLDSYPQLADGYYIINAKQNNQCPVYYQQHAQEVRKVFGPYIKK